MPTLKIKLPSTYRLSLWQHWISACTLGELIGMALVALIAVLFHQIMGEVNTLSEKLLQLFIMMLAGVIEGFFLGYFQWRILHRRFPFLPSRKWIGATVLAGLTGWFLGMSATLFLMPTETVSAAPPPLDSTWMSTFFYPAIMGLALGSLFGFFQFLPLRKYTQNATSWIWANALAWVPAMICIFLIASIPSSQTPLWLLLCLGILAGLLAGLSVGLVTGYFFQKMELKPHLPTD